MAISGTVFTCTYPPSSIVAEACRRLARHAERDNDLSQVTVLLPDLHAAAAFGRALHAMAGGPVLLPRLTTLRQWASEVPLARPPTSSMAREAAIYHALAERRWFHDQDLWSVAGELSDLFDELTRWHVGMPASADDFVRALERAYEARAGARFAFEARLVHELWHALAADATDAEAAYQLRLGMLAGEVAGPVHAVGLGRLTPAEEAFLQRCAERVPVVRIAEDIGAESASLLERTLQAAWPRDIVESLSGRAADLRREGRESPLSTRLRFCGAAEAEQEAQIIAAAVRRGLAAGCKSIAVVTLDRVVARRARALLERDQVLVRDEAGWPLSTTSAATAVGRWFDLLGNAFHHRDLLDLLKSPFAFADWPRAQRQRTVWRFEQALRRANVRTGIERYLELAQRSRDQAMRQMLLRVERGARLLGRGRRKSLSGWIDALRKSLREIGVTQGFERDAAGVQVLEVLDTLEGELAADRIGVDFGEFRRWMARRLEAAAFRDASIDSPVVFTSLEATRLRSFDAVLIVGADASRLPGSGQSGMFFNQRVRRELGLPGVEAHVRAVEEALSGLIARSGQTLVTWQRTLAGEPNLISPLFERLRTLHELAWGEALEDDDLAREAETHFDAASSQPARAPAPRIPAARVPQAISPSGYNTLLACPYRYYARYALGLSESDDVQDELEKRDYGTLVHDVLTRFHRDHPSLSGMDAGAAEEALRAVSDAVFADELARSYLARAWLARWRALIPRYVAWQREWEAQGWRFHAGEIDRNVTIETPGGRKLLLRGRIDRVDVRDDGAVAVIDYKTRKSDALEDELASLGEDVQLPVYALLWGGAVAQALYLAMDLEQVESVSLQHDIQLHAADVRDRLTDLVDRISEGSPLPAQGTEAVCRYCEMHGLCRRKHWA